MTYPFGGHMLSLLILIQYIELYLHTPVQDTTDFSDFLKQEKMQELLVPTLPTHNPNIPPDEVVVRWGNLPFVVDYPLYGNH